MELIETEDKSVSLKVSRDELVMLNNTLNEICNGIDLHGFETRIGYSREEVSSLLAEFRPIIHERRSAE